MRRLPLLAALLFAIPAYAETIMINNGLAPPNAANVIDDLRYAYDAVWVRNVGCPPGWPAGDPREPCPSPGAATEVSVLPGASVNHIYVDDTSAVNISGGYTLSLSADEDATLIMSGGLVMSPDFVTGPSAHGNSTVVINGGEMGSLEAHDSSTVTMSGGTVSDSIASWISSTVRIIGTDFALDGSPVSYGAFTGVSGYLTGTLASGDGLGVDLSSPGTLVLSPPTECSDFVDNDGDGLTDYPEDPGCADASDLSERDPTLPCDDGADNDGDGRIDFDPLSHADPGDQFTLPAGSGDPGCISPIGLIEDPYCQDGIDNDGDGKVDYDAGLSANGSADPAGPDPHCVGQPWLIIEGLPCGLGVELALLLPPLMWLYRRARRES